jgi:hypothetical protein
MRLGKYILFIVCSIVINGCFYNTIWLSGKYYSLDGSRKEYLLINFENNSFSQCYIINDSAHFNEGNLWVDKKSKVVNLSSLHSYDLLQTLENPVVIKTSGVQFSYSTGVLSMGERKESYALEGYDWP